MNIANPVCDHYFHWQLFPLRSVFDSFGVKTMLTLPAKICHSALGLYMTVNNTSGHLEQFVDALMVTMQLASNL
jgi:hypothetical protein